jgi:hypothetical protein
MKYVGYLVSYFSRGGNAAVNPQAAPGHQAEQIAALMTRFLAAAKNNQAITQDAQDELAKLVGILGRTGGALNGCAELDDLKDALENIKKANDAKETSIKAKYAGMTVTLLLAFRGLLDTVSSDMHFKDDEQNEGSYTLLGGLSLMIGGLVSCGLTYVGSGLAYRTSLRDIGIAERACKKSLLALRHKDLFANEAFIQMYKKCLEAEMKINVIERDATGVGIDGVVWVRGGSKQRVQTQQVEDLRLQIKKIKQIIAPHTYDGQLTEGDKDGIMEACRQAKKVIGVQSGLFNEVKGLFEGLSRAGSVLPTLPVAASTRDYANEV